ncbi:MAG: hypothetical protein Ct9H300mP16_16170 [Pseudomonadota bacterium]|nr:MAG: hypothetical protein Ct9H300mP16_16170 [Pseudomonadota bacterium]
MYPYVAGSTVLLEELIEPSRRIIVSWSTAVPEAGGRDLADIAAEWDCSLAQAMSVYNRAAVSTFVWKKRMSRESLPIPWDVWFGRYPSRQAPTTLWGTFPVFLAITAGTAGVPTRRGGAQDDRAVSPDFWACRARRCSGGGFWDLVVFDSSRIADSATFEQPTRAAAGIDCVIVNGAIAWQAGAGPVPGRDVCSRTPEPPENDYS